MDPDEGDHEGGRPTVDGTENPPQGNFGHDPGDAGVGSFQSGPVVENQHEAGDHLNGKEEKDKRSRRIPRANTKASGACFDLRFQGLD